MTAAADRTSEPAEEKPKKKASKRQRMTRIGAALLLIVIVAGVFASFIPTIIDTFAKSPIQTGKYVMKVNDHEVLAEVFSYFFDAEFTNYISYLGVSYFEDADSFSNFLDYVQDEVVFYYSFYDWGVENGYEIDDDIKAQAQESLDSMKESYDTEEEWQEYLDSMYIDEDTYFQILCLFDDLNEFYEYVYYDKDGYYARTDEEWQELIDSSDIYGAKHILFATSGDEDADADILAEAEDVLWRITENGEDFDTLMNEYSDDTGLSSYPDGYTFTEGDMVDEFYDATIALEIGEIDDEIVTSDYGYHIIKRVEPVFDDAVQIVIENLYLEDIQTKIDSAEVSTANGYDKITFSDFAISAEYLTFDEDASDTTEDSEG